MKEYLKENLVLKLFIVLYAILLILLCNYRLPWNDEGWVSSYAGTLYSSGKMIDLVRDYYTDTISQKLLLLKLFPYIQWLWFKLTTLDLVAARYLSTLFALLNLVLIYKITRNFLKTNLYKSLIIIVIALNYYFILAATQVRPEIIYLFFCLASLYAYLKWDQTKKSKYLFISHVCLILGTMIHLVVAFIGLAVWIISFIDIYKSNKKFKNYIAFIIPYFLFIIIFLIHDGVDSIPIYKSTFFQGTASSWDGHSGGIFYYMFFLASRGKYTTATIIFAIFIFCMLSLVIFYLSKTSKVMSVFAAGFLLAWMLTARYLELPINILLIIFVWLSGILFFTYLESKKRLLKLVTIGLIGFSFIFILFSTAKVFEVLKTNSFNAYKADFNLIEKKYLKNNIPINCTHELYWFLKFDTSKIAINYKVPVYAIINSDDQKEILVLENREYKRIERLKYLSLYKLNKND